MYVGCGETDSDGMRGSDHSGLHARVSLQLLNNQHYGESATGTVLDKGSIILINV